jgi:hypothetical protein
MTHILLTGIGSATIGAACVPRSSGICWVDGPTNEELPMQAFVVAIIGLLGALIAYFQWRTAHQRVVLELFDRRVAVFRELEDAAKGMLNAVGRKDMEAPFWSYIRAEANARFLFGEEVIAALTRLRGDIADAMSFSEISDDQPERQQMSDRKYRALQNIAAFLQGGSAPLFGPYIRLDQKMPGLWWPFR